MSGWSPPSPSQNVVAGLVFASILLLAYAVLIQGSFLLGVIPVLLIAFGYLLWRVLAAVEAVADAAQRIADELESD